MKDEPKAAEAQHAGEAGPAMTDVRSRAAQVGKLSEFEREVASFAAEGLPVPAIAQKLGRSRATCASALDRVYAKLGVSDRKALYRLFYG